MNRRLFLTALAGTGAAIAVPELWVPNRSIFLPPRGGWFQRPLLEVVRDYVERWRPMGVAVTVDRDVLSGCADYTVIESPRSGSVRVAIAPDLPPDIEREIRKAARGVPVELSGTIYSVLPGLEHTSCHICTEWAGWQSNTRFSRPM